MAPLLLSNCQGSRLRNPRRMHMLALLQPGQLLLIAELLLLGLVCSAGLLEETGLPGLLELHAC